MQLYPFQHEIIEASRKEFLLGSMRLLIQSPTGSGKTVIFSHIVKESFENKVSVLILVHRKELLEQASNKLKTLLIPHGLIQAKSKIENQPIQIGMIQTVRSRLNQVTEPQLIICDEAHHAISNSYQLIFDQFKSARILGFTATPERMGGKGLGDAFQKMILGPSVRDLIEQKFLADYKMFVPPNDIDLGGVKRDSKKGDYNQSQLASAMKIDTDKPKLAGDALKHYKKYLDGKRALGFCVSINHAKKMAQHFSEAGILSHALDGTMSAVDRECTLSAFAKNQIKVIFSCELIGEGFDVPECEGVLLLRPTQSLIVYLQQVGRALRADPNNPNKVAIIIDHANNSKRHNYPCDVRAWSLDGKPKREKLEDGLQKLSIKTCSFCYMANPASQLNCFDCGAEFPKKISNIRTDKNIELVEIDRTQLKRNKEQDYNLCKTFSDLKRFAEKYSLSPGWAFYQFRANEIEKIADRHSNNWLNLDQIAAITRIRPDMIRTFLRDISMSGKINQISCKIDMGQKTYKGDSILFEWVRYTRQRGGNFGQSAHNTSKSNHLEINKEVSVYETL